MCRGRGWRESHGIRRNEYNCCGMEFTAAEIHEVCLENVQAYGIFSVKFLTA